MKKIVFTLIFYFIAATAIAQYCSCISETKDPKSETETKSGTTKSSDSYSLVIQKETSSNNLNKNSTYFLSLDANSKNFFSSNLTNNKGKIELLLKDKSKLVLENAKCFYNPVTSGFCFTFGAVVSREQLEIILLNPIVTFSAFDILKTTFKEKKQREQQIIISCLLSEDY